MYIILGRGSRDRTSCHGRGIDAGRIGRVHYVSSSAWGICKHFPRSYNRIRGWDSTIKEGYRSGPSELTASTANYLSHCRQASSTPLDTYAVPSPVIARVSSVPEAFTLLAISTAFALTLAIIQQLQYHCSVAHSIPSQSPSPTPTPEQSSVRLVWFSRSVLHLVAGVGCLCSAWGYSFSPPGRWPVWVRCTGVSGVAMIFRWVARLGSAPRAYWPGGGGRGGYWVSCVKCLHRDGKGEGDERI